MLSMTKTLRSQIAALLTVGLLASFVFPELFWPSPSR
jgi:hypothetical protein